MDLNLSGKHALVCGGSEGIGRAAAHELALLGADVTVLARRAERLQAVAAALPHVYEGQRHDWIAADVADQDALQAQVETLVKTRAAHVLVNNTGGPPGGRAIDAHASAYLDAFHRHLLANHALVQAVLPGMRAARWGRIINVITTSVKEPIANLGVSNSIRGAVASWPRPCHANWALTASRSTTCCPVTHVRSGWNRYWMTVRPAPENRAMRWPRPYCPRYP